MGALTKLACCFLAISTVEATSLRSTPALPSPLLPDAPFSEIWADRQPFSGIWTTDTIPTNWTELPCSSAFSVVSVSAEAVLLCSEPRVMVTLSTSATAALPQQLQDSAVFTAIDSCGPEVTFLVADASIGLATVSCSSTVCVIGSVLIDADTFGVPSSLLSYPLLSSPFPSSAGKTNAHSKSDTHAPTNSKTRIWLSGSKGVFAFDTQDCKTVSALVFSDAGSSAALAYSPLLSTVAIGNSTKLTLVNATTAAVKRFDWVTNIAQGWGAPIDDVITALLYTPDGTLYIGNPTCLNARYPNGTFVRFAGPDGLPVGNITALAADDRVGGAGRSSPRLWIGSLQGAVLFDPLATSWDGRQAAPGYDTQEPLSPRWRYFYGPRYFPSTPADAFGGSAVAANGIVSIGNNTYMVTNAGLTVLEAIQWTLQDKAAWMESQLGIFDLYGQGMVGDCGLASFGRYPCTNGPNDNNGLWTSLIVAAESMRYAVTTDPDALATATHYFYGMKLLNEVTGIHGLMARSALPPGEPCPSNDPDWHASSSLPGYCFKGTASSDEVVGHLMAYPIFGELVNGELGATAFSLLINMSVYIVKNNFTLVDVTGAPTQWGHWEPSLLNRNESWSDVRGLNSLQSLSMISAALQYMNGDDAQAIMLQHALSYLALENDYLTNIVNTRINAPIDINYSDDELTFFTYMALFFSCSQRTTLQSYALASIMRSWDTAVGALHSNMWGSIYLAATGPYANCSTGTPTVANNSATAQIARDIVWNLMSWSPDLITWPSQNSHRQDIIFNTQLDRFGISHDQSMRVLAQYERCQSRWNANSYQLDDCGGGSMSDPGVWLYPYWLARYIGVIG